MEYSKIEIVLPIQINNELSLNRIYTGTHWRQRKNDADYFHNVVKFELISSNIPKKVFENPVRIKFFWNTGFDLDNHGYVAKLIIDGLKGFLIRNDDKKYVKEINHAYWDGNGVKLEISEYKI